MGHIGLLPGQRGLPKILGMYTSLASQGRGEVERLGSGQVVKHEVGLDGKTYCGRTIKANGNGDACKSCAKTKAKDDAAWLNLTAENINAMAQSMALLDEISETAGRTVEAVKAGMVALDDVETRADEAIGYVKANGRVFAAEVHNFGGADAFALAVELGRLTLVEAGDMSRYVLTRHTACHLSDCRRPVTGETPMNVLFRWPASETNTRMVPTCAKHTVTLAPVEPLPIRTPQRVFTDQDMRDQIIAYLGSDVNDFYVDGIVDHIIADQGCAVDLAMIEVDGFSEILAMYDRPVITADEVREIAALPDCCNECDWDEVAVWAGTGTLVKAPIRTNLARRKRKASKVNKRRVKGGF